MKQRLNWRAAICVFIGFMLAPVVLEWWGARLSQGERIGVAALAGALGAAIGLGAAEIWTRLARARS